MLEVRPDFPQGFWGYLLQKKANNLKITNVALVATSQGFLRVTKGYHRLPQVTTGHQRSQMSNWWGLAQFIF